MQFSCRKSIYRERFSSVGYVFSLSFSLSLSVLIALPAHSQSENKSAIKERGKTEEAIVEGLRVDENISEFAIDIYKYGTQVQLISADEIETGGFTNFGELAAGLIRGANIGYSPDEGEFTIRLDDGTDRDTLLLINGVPTFDRGLRWRVCRAQPRLIHVRLKR